MSNAARWYRLLITVSLLGITASAFHIPQVANALGNSPVNRVAVQQLPLFKPQVSTPVEPGDTTGLAPAQLVEQQALLAGGELESAQLIGGRQRPLPGAALSSADALDYSERDAALQSSLPALLMPEPQLNFEGIRNLSGLVPPDPAGEVGRNHYVQMVNISTAVYDKTGRLLYGPFYPSQLWPANDVCRSRNDGDPIVLYDQLADRWILSQFALPNFPNGPFYECIAISKSGIPTNNPNDWWPYTFLVSNNKMNDYPKLAVWPNGYVMTVNQFLNGGPWAGAGVLVFDRQKMLNGQAAQFQYFDLAQVDANFGGMLPADLDGTNPPPAGSPAFVFEVDDDFWAPALGPDAIRMWKLVVDWNDPSRSMLGRDGLPDAVLPVASFDLLPCTLQGTRDCIPQPGTTQKLDALGNQLMYRVAYRNFGSYAAFALNHTVRGAGTNQAAIRWYEVRLTGGTAQVYQQGTFAPDDGLHRWTGSIAMDVQGNLALGYSVASGQVYPSIRYTGRLVSDPPGTLAQGEQTIISGSGAQISAYARWGDYSQMSVDPVDDCTFWYTQEYIELNGVSNWQTRIAAFKFPNCSSLNGELSGQVANAQTGAPIAGALIQARRDEVLVASTVTSPDGTYRLLLPPATYNITISIYGFSPVTDNQVVIQAQEAVSLSKNLDPAPTYTITGRVTDARTGWPLYAQLQISNYPGGVVWTDPETGNFQVELVGGSSYGLTVTSWSPGYETLVFNPVLLTGDQQVNLILNPDLEACTAPGYFSGEIRFAEEFESGALPAGWSNLDHTGGGAWAFSDPNRRGNRTQAAGQFATLDSDYYGSTARQDAELRTPLFNLAGLNTIELSFYTDLYFYTAGSQEVAEVDLSTDKGANWTNIWHKAEGDSNIRGKVSIDITSLAAGRQEVQVRFHYYEASWENWWQIDRVYVQEKNCESQPGGLIVGHVMDENTGLPLEAATVRLADGDSVQTRDGFFILFAPVGTQELIVSKEQYAVQSIAVKVPLNGAVQQDFQLAAPRLSLTLTEVWAALPDSASQETTVSLEIRNTGNLTATYQLVTLPVSSTSFGPLPEPENAVKPFRRHTASAQGLKLPAPPEAADFPAGAIRRTWNWGSHARLWGLAYDPRQDLLWLASPATDWGGTSQVRAFTPPGAPHGVGWPYFHASDLGPADAAFHPGTGTIWVTGADAGNCLREVDPAGGETGQSLCLPATPYALRGLAYDAVTGGWLAGGWAERMIYRFDANGALLARYRIDLPVAGLAYHAGNGRLFVMTSGSPSWVYVLDASRMDILSILGRFLIPGLTDWGGAGLDLDCVGNLWAVDQNTGRVYEVDSGQPGGACASQVPWLAVSPSSDQIEPQGEEFIQLRFLRGDLLPGVYQAQIRIIHNTPYIVQNLPVTLQVGRRIYLPWVVK